MGATQSFLRLAEDLPVSLEAPLVFLDVNSLALVRSGGMAMVFVVRHPLELAMPATARPSAFAAQCIATHCFTGL